MRAVAVRVEEGRIVEAPIQSDRTHVLPLELGRAMPVIVRGEGVWVEDAGGHRYLDAMSGGSMAATLGHGRRDIIEAARAQAERLAFVHNERLTNPLQERLADELVAVAPEGFSRVRFTVAGADAIEMAIQLARTYHVERGEHDRWQVISPAQAYHGPTMETLALAGRAGLHGPFGPYLPSHLHIPPSTWRFDPSGDAALAALDRALEQAGPENVSAFFCEAISAAALPAYTPPRRFWQGLAERRDRFGFLVCFDEVVTGVGRTGNWFAGAVLVREHVYEAVSDGSRRFPLGHTWDGAPLAGAVGLAVLAAMRSEQVVERVRDRGPSLRDELESALADIPLVREVRGHGYLLGVEYVDPRDHTSFLPRELRVAGRIDDVAFERGLITLSTQPTRDGFAGDQSLFAPAFTATDAELREMVSRFADVVGHVAEEVEEELSTLSTSGGSR
ncbi:MAG: aspartate aminotransferase family protein [Actinobacteria bacterium]|nr:MAG: aspartate aminotransferase family protein [Actinomycetota bacterium]